MIENGTLLQDRYLIKEKIGTGGMGAVYLAVDRRFDNAVAIKETFYKEDEFGEAFEREARLLNALQHPVLPHVSDYFAENDGYFLVMQFIEGEDLSDILKREGAFPVEDVLRWTRELLDALDYLHSQEPPVIHRDIKPHNLKLTPRGQIMLLDFGLAKVNKKDATEVSVFGYSRTYSPLEQIQGTGTDARSDIFALGASLFHLLTGTPPINALTRASAIVGGNRDPLKLANEIRPEVPDAVANVINSALALNAENRFLTANAMRQALEYARKGEPQINAAVVGASPQTIKQSENQNFPALESFSAAKNSLDIEEPEAAKVTTDNSEKSSSSPIVVDIPTKVSGDTANNQNRFIWAAAAVLLLFGIAAAFYFTSGEDSGAQINQTTINANLISVNSNRESAAETKSKTSSDDRQAEKSETDEPKNESNAQKSSVSTEQPAQNAPAERQNRTSENDEAETKEEPLETEEVPEVVVPENENKRNQKRRPRPEVRPIPDVMTEEEFEQIKREEKQRRRDRRNRNKPDESELN